MDERSELPTNFAQSIYPRILYSRFQFTCLFIPAGPSPPIVAHEKSIRLTIYTFCTCMLHSLLAGREGTLDCKLHWYQKFITKYS